MKSNDMNDEGIHLDRAIAIWVLIPITAAMLAVGALRHELARVARKTPHVTIEDVREANIAMRCERIRAHAGYLPRESFEMRKTWACASEGGALRAPSVKASGPAAMLADPNALQGMMTKNLGMVIPNMLTAAWVNYFFTGFVVGRVPFPLTQRFRGMLQRGVALKSLDVTYVSSLSWYFLNFFGLGGVFELLFGKNSLNDAHAMEAQFASSMNAEKTFAAHIEGLEMLKHEYTMPVADERARNILLALNAGKSPAEARAEASRKPKR